MTHVWKFARVGGFDQVEVSSGADLVALEQLDLKLWAALTMPVKGLHFDVRTLELLDGDSDGRIHAREFAAAAKWAGSMLKDVEALGRGTESLALSAIGDTGEARVLRDAARLLLNSLGKPDAEAISVGEIVEAVKAFEARAYNGDGVLPAESAADEESKLAITDVLATTTPATDKSGKPGVTKDTVKAFFDDVEAHVAWADGGLEDRAVHPLDGKTGAAFAALEAVRPKIDDYFARARVAQFDARALASINREDKEYIAALAQDLSSNASAVEHFPLAVQSGTRGLPLDANINPAWAARIAAFRSEVVTPTIGERSALTESEWADVVKRFGPHAAWVGAKKGASVEKLGLERLRVLASPALRAKVEKQVAADSEEAPLAAAIDSVEKLVRFNRDLIKLANNFVSFREFYARQEKATFQAGVLYLDERSMDLCTRINDAGKHATMAPMSNFYLLTLDCKNAKGESMQVSVAVTQGDVDNLMVGRNGVFIDRNGVDWAATITKIFDNPISMRQAFWWPFKKLTRAVEERAAKRAADAQAAADAKVTTAATDTKLDPKAPVAAPKFDVGTVAALGVAVGGITTAIGLIIGSFLNLGMWMPFGILAVLLMISGPSMALAWLKLRKRNLGPILDASGWAVNAMARVSVSFGSTLTKPPKRPANSKYDPRDPYADKSFPVRTVIAVLVILVLAGTWFVGSLDRFLPVAARSTSVLGAAAPASVPAGPPPAEAAPVPQP